MAVYQSKVDFESACVCMDVGLSVDFFRVPQTTL